MGGRALKKTKEPREYPSLSILCEMYRAASEPDGLNGYFGTFGTKQCEQYNEACAALGDRVHKYVESWLVHGVALQLHDSREHHMARTVADWADESKMKLVDCSFSETGKAVEVPLNSRFLNFSCRADYICTFGDSPVKWIGDLKTSSGISDSYRVQLAGYAVGWWEKTGEWIDQGWLARVEKKPKATKQLEIVEVHDLHEWVEPLIRCRQLWDFINRKGAWREYDQLKAARVLS